MQNFFECIKSRKEPNAPVETGVASARAGQIANLAYRGTGHRMATEERGPEFFCGVRTANFDRHRALNIPIANSRPSRPICTLAQPTL